MADIRATQKIDPKLHEEMKKIVKEKGGTVSLFDEYEIAIKNHIKNHYQENIIENTQLENFINERIGKMENHLASMMGRTGMDVSMTLMGVILFLEKYFDGQATREQLQGKLRKDGARYFTTVVNEDKKNKK